MKTGTKTEQNIILRERHVFFFHNFSSIHGFYTTRWQYSVRQLIRQLAIEKSYEEKDRLIIHDQDM